MTNGNLSNDRHAKFSFYIEDMFSAKCIWAKYFFPKQAFDPHTQSLHSSFYLVLSP